MSYLEVKTAMETTFSMTVAQYSARLNKPIVSEMNNRLILLEFVDFVVQYSGTGQPCSLPVVLTEVQLFSAKLNSNF